ncbi:hypothetical protein HPB47_027342, partial [Ixodes persulcatus]
MAPPDIAAEPGPDQLKKKGKTLQQTRRKLSLLYSNAQELLKELKDQQLLSEKCLEVFKAAAFKSSEKGQRSISPSTACIRTRLMKILRAEWQRQARVYRDLMRAALCDSNQGNRDNHRLRASFPKRQPVARGNVQSVIQVPIPDDVRQVLGFGPKFAVEPKLSPPELIGL